MPLINETFTTHRGRKQMETKLAKIAQVAKEKSNERWIRETNESEPPIKHRNGTMMTSKPELLLSLWDEYGSNLFTDHVVSGVEVA